MQRVDRLAGIVAGRIMARGANAFVLVGIPRGGIPAAYAIAQYMRPDTVVTSIDDNLSRYSGSSEKLVLVDDITTTGQTIEDALKKMPDPLDTLAAVLLCKNPGEDDAALYAENVAQDDWVEFPWESREHGGKPLDAVVRLLEYVGDDPTREGLLKTPERFLKFLDEQRIGEAYEATTFKSDITDLQVENNVPFGSLCEHHMLPYFGTASIGYIPNGKLLGLSKLVRITADHCRGLTMQEVMTAQVGSAIQEAVDTEDVAVITTAQHTCMIIRGVKVPGATMTSSAMLGKFRDAPALRAEFMTLAGMN